MVEKTQDKKIIKSIRAEEWYEHFIEQCHAIIAETKIRATIELVRGKWELGKRILEEELNFKKAGYGKRMIETIAEDMSWSNSHIWKCLQFYKKFPEKDFEKVIPQLETGTKNITWYRICQHILPKLKEELDKIKKLEEEQAHCTHNKFRCLDCKKELTLKEIKDIL